MKQYKTEAYINSANLVKVSKFLSENNIPFINHPIDEKEELSSEEINDWTQRRLKQDKPKKIELPIIPEHAMRDPSMKSFIVWMQQVTDALNGRHNA